MEETFSVVKSLRGWIPGILGTIILVIGALPLPLPAQSKPGTPPTAGHIDPQARQMLDRAILALGGPPFLTAKSITTKGRAFFFQDGATAGMEPFESWVVYPDKRRFSYGKTKPVILINNGDNGWELDRYGLIAQPQSQLRGWILSNHYSLENMFRLRISEPGTLIQVGKADFVDNVPTQGIEITESGSTRVRLDLHRQTLLPYRITYRVWNANDNAWDDYTDAYADYRDVDGIQTPMHITRYLNGDRVGETFRITAQYNQEYPSNYFTAQ